MSLSPTTVLRHIERRLGVSHHQLELSRDQIMDTVFEETLITFSTYFPHHHRIIIDRVKDAVEGRVGVYYLKTDFEILGISKILTDNLESNMNISTYFHNPIDRQILANTESAVINPTTFRWEPPDKLEIFPKNIFPYNILCELKVVHPKHLKTIPLSLREEFLKLALYDVQISLLQIRRYFETISTNFGEIQLFLQELEEAPDKREELLEVWRTNLLRTPYRKKIFVY